MNPSRLTFFFLATVLVLAAFCYTAEASIITPPLADDPSLVLRLALDEGDGTVAVDSSGNGNNGTIYGANWTTGRYGYALQFDGVDDYVVAPKLQINDTVTVVAWVYSDNYNVAETSIVDFTDLLVLRLSFISNTVKFAVHDGTWRYASSSAILTPGWHMFVGVYSVPNSRFEVWVDTNKFSSSFIPTNPITDADSVTRLQGKRSGQQIIIDEVRIYNRVLNDSEIKAMYEALRIKIKDETTAQPINNANVTIFNSNTSISVPVDSVTHDAVLFHANMSSYGYSQYFVSVSADNYYERKLITNINDGQLTEMNAYLPPTSSTVVLDVFNLVDYSGSFNNATLQIKKPIGGSLETIFENYFDFNHEAQAYLILSDYYQIYISNNVETRNLGWFQPDPDGQVTIQLTKIDIRNFYSPWISINFDANETTGLITLEYNTTNVTVTKAQYWVNLTNGTNMYYAEMNASAGTFTYSADLNTTYLVRFRVETAEGKVYDPFWYVYWGNVTQKVPFLPSDLPWWASAVIVVGIIIVYLLAFGNFRADASTALAAILVGLFWWLGWLKTNYIVIVIVGIIAVAAIVTYQRKEVRD